MTSRRSPRRQTLRHAEVLEIRSLMSADFTFGAMPGQTVAGYERPVLTAEFSGPVAEIDSAMIDWGDGSVPSAGTVTSGTWFGSPILGGDSSSSREMHGSVEGSHLYALPGNYTVTTTAIAHIAGQPDQALATTSTVGAQSAQLGLNPAQTVHQVKGSPSSDAYALITTNVPDAEHHLKATIDWGDGSALTEGVISRSTYYYGIRPLFRIYGYPTLDDVAVRGDHAYAAAGAYPVTITVEDGRGSSVVTTGVAQVQESPFVLESSESTTVIDPTNYGGGLPIAVANGSDLSVTDFTDANFSHYTAVIDWGDGTTPSAGSLSTLPQLLGGLTTHPQFAIGGKHSFATTGDYTATVTLTDDQGHTAQITSTVHAIAESMHTDGYDFETVQGPDPYRMGSLLASGWTSLVHDASDLKATIDWGDGTTSDSLYLRVSQYDHPTGFYVYGGDHDYAAPGHYTIHVTVTTTSGLTSTTTSTASVDRFGGYSILQPMMTGQATDGITLAHVIIPGQDASPSDFSATIDWGDGTSGVGTISVADRYEYGTWPAVTGGEVTLAVGGSHVYTTPGRYWVTETVTDNLGETHEFHSSLVVTAADTSASAPGGSMGSDGSTDSSGSGGGGGLITRSVSAPSDSASTPATTTVRPINVNHATKGHAHAKPHLSHPHKLHPAKTTVASHPHGALAVHRHKVR